MRGQVEAHLRKLHEILAGHRMGVADLAAPSRRAAQFLASIRWDELPAHGAADSARAPQGTLTWRGLSSYVERAMERLAEPIDDAQLAALQESLAAQSRRIEGVVRRQNVPPERIAPSARALRGWVAFFSRPENLGLYVAAQRAALPLLGAAAGRSRAARGRPLRVYFRPLRGIYRLRTTPRGMALSLPAAMVAFDAPAFEALSQLAFGDDRTARQRVITAMTAEGFQSLRAELEALGGIHEQTRGAFHDLAASFERVNAEYFAGTMPRPRLTWSRDFTGRKFGHYDWILDTVMVSATLDRGDVPAFVVDFIVYHELLHKKHGLAWTNGRGYAHTAEFYAEERRFARHAEADAAIERLARSSDRRA